MKNVKDLPFKVSSCGTKVINTNTGHKYGFVKDKDGYLCVSTRISGVSRNFRVHRLVAMAYLQNPNNYPQVNHKNGVKSDNSVDNLEWCNNSMNQLHAVRTGLRKIQYGESANGSKLKETVAENICELIQDGWRNKDIADKLQVTRSQVKDIRTGRAWKQLSKNYNLMFVRKGRLSEKTVRWVCEKILEGKSNPEILKESTSKGMTLSIIGHIRKKNSYKDVVKDYNF